MSRFHYFKSTFLAAVVLSVIPLHNARAQVPSRGLTASGNFIAVMGEVKNAGVYEFVETAPPLVDVLRFAGGFTRFADQSVRIIRGGRSGLREFVTPSNDVTLLPGDVVIADSSQRLQRRDNSTTTDINNLPSVEVAIIGLLDRPAVTTVNGAKSTLGGFLKHLGQPESLISRVRLVESRMSSRKLLATTRLSDNCVVVIPNPRDVDRRGIPALPPSFARVSVASINSPVQYPGRIEPIPQPQPRPPMHPVPYPPVGMYPRQPLTASAIPTLIQPPATDEDNDDSNSPSGRAGVTDSVPGQTFVEDFNGQDPNRVYQPVPGRLQPHRMPIPIARNIPPAVENLHPPVTRPSPTIEQADAETGSGPSLENAIAKAESAVPPAQKPVEANKPQIIPSQEADSDVAMIVLYLALVGLLVIGILLLAMVRTEPPPKKTAAQVATKTVTEADLLDRLIRNELPILEEPPDLPTKLEFFGQTRSDRKLRIDQAHSSPAKPHFDRRETVAQRVPPRAPHFQQRRSVQESAKVAQPQTAQPQTAQPQTAQPQAAQPPTATRVPSTESDAASGVESPKANPKEQPVSLTADRVSYDRWLADYRKTSQGGHAEQLAKLDDSLPRSKSAEVEPDGSAELQAEQEAVLDANNAATTAETAEDIANDAKSKTRDEESLTLAKTLAPRSSGKRRDGRRLRIDTRHHHNGPKSSVRPDTESAIVSEPLLSEGAAADEPWVNDADEQSFETDYQEPTDFVDDHESLESFDEPQSSSDLEPVDQPVWTNRSESEVTDDRDDESNRADQSPSETSVLDRVLMSVHGR